LGEHGGGENPADGLAATFSESEGLTGLSDGEFVNLPQQGEEGAFAELMHRHSKGMRQVAFSILRDTEEVEDELQNAWWNAWQHIQVFAGDSRFSTWLTRIVINQCLMRLRQTRRRLGKSGLLWSSPTSTRRSEQGLGRGDVSELVRREIAHSAPAAGSESTADAGSGGGLGHLDCGREIALTTRSPRIA
jgi:DNA-directed RNA polymerase specialized sigma24 family protein